MTTDPTVSFLRQWMARPAAYERQDETDDAQFYQTPRMVSHLDATAGAVLQRYIGAFLGNSTRTVLDLMASFESHLPDSPEDLTVTGLGMNQAELDANPRLSTRVIHDLNADPRLPFDDDAFDLVINTVSVPYLTQPVAVFRDVARVLRSGGRHLVIFSNRMFASKAVQLWRQTTDDEHLTLIRLFFEEAGGFSEPRHLMTMGLPRPADDKYAASGLPADPVFAVYASHGVGLTDEVIPDLSGLMPGPADPDELAARKAEFTSTGRCPHCGEPMGLWPVTENPAGDWDHDVFVCMNDSCPYLVRGWQVMYDQGNPGMAYRNTYDPISGTFGPVSIPSLMALKSQVTDVGFLEYRQRTARA